MDEIQVIAKFSVLYLPLAPCVTWIGLELLFVLSYQPRLLSILCKFRTIVLDLAWLIFDWLTGLKYSYLIVAEYFFLLLLVVW